MINYRHVLFVLSILIFLFSALMLVPFLVDFCLLADSNVCFFTAAIFSAFIGGVLFVPIRTSNVFLIDHKEKVLVVLLSWIILPLLSAIPFFISPFPISKIDALFEVVSALTTSGSTAIYDMCSFSDGFIVWRSILQFVGAIGFIASCTYVFAFYRSSYKKSHIVDIELAEDTLIANVKAIVSIYLFLSFVAMLFLVLFENYSTIEAFCCAFSSISSGGMFIYDQDCASTSFSNGAVFVMSILMFASGCSVNFLKNLRNNWRVELKNSQFLAYVGTIIFSILVVTIAIHSKLNEEHSIIEIVKNATLFVIASITTTGTPVVDSESAGQFINIFLYIMNFIGGCSGSCTGGIKIFRFIIIFLVVKNYILRLSRTNTIYVPSYSGKRIDDFDITSVFSFFICGLVMCLVLSIVFAMSSGFEISKSIGAVLTSLNNSHTFLGLQKATTGQIASLPVLSKGVLMFSMIAGRVEFMLFFVVFAKSFWKK